MYDEATEPVDVDLSVPYPLSDAFAPDIDVGLLIENLKLTPAQRLDKLVKLIEMCDELRQGMARAQGQR